MSTDTAANKPTPTAATTAPTLQERKPDQVEHRVKLLADGLKDGTMDSDSFAAFIAGMIRASSAPDHTVELAKALIGQQKDLHEEKLHKWKAAEKRYLAQYEARVETTKNTAANFMLRSLFEQRVEQAAGQPLHPDFVFILSALLYLPEEVNVRCFLADLLLNVGPDERLQIHNWIIQRGATDTIKETLARAIDGGQLQYPLLPGRKFAMRNRVMAEEALAANATLQGAGPGRRHVKCPVTDSLYGNKGDAEPLVGAGPQTSVPVYAHGNPEPVGLADTTLISDGMGEVAGAVRRLQEQNASLKKNIAALEKKIGQRDAPNNRGGYGGARGRGGSRGGYRGRGGPSGHYYGAGTEYEDGAHAYHYDQAPPSAGMAHEQAKNQYGAS